MVFVKFIKTVDFVYNGRFLGDTARLRDEYGLSAGALKRTVNRSDELDWGGEGFGRAHAHCTALVTQWERNRILVSCHSDNITAK